MSTANLRTLQRALNGAGFGPLAEDGLWGPLTAAAASRAAAAGRLAVTDDAPDLPWMRIARSALGLHETRDNAALRRFLGSDGDLDHDPAEVPWCGEFVATCVRLAMPGEPFPGDLGRNHWWARNWTAFGAASPLTRGAVAAFSRTGGGGHVGFVVGEDGAGHIAVLGGNQSNAVTIERLPRSRLLPAGLRWPATWPEQPVRLPRVPATGKISINEA